MEQEIIEKLRLLPQAGQVEVLRYVEVLVANFAKVNCGELEKCFWYLAGTSLDGRIF
jgi:hypothetical protein